MDISITTSKCYNKKEGKINVKKGTTMTKTVQKSKARDMTQGSIWKQLLLFSLPLMAGNLFQQLYNTVDSIVVGNFVGKEALAAVGSVGPIINSLIGFFMGLSTGAGVIISQYYGAKADEKVSRTVSTTLVMTFILSIVFTILGILITPYMLRMMSTPDDVIRESATYLKIYFGGVAGLMFYNMGSGVLRAIGDSRHPLYFLIFSAVVNTVLDLLFVVSFGMGIEGVALATVIAKAYNIATTSGADNSARIAFVENKKALALVEGTEFNWFMVLAFAALAVGWVVLYKTRFGLRLMACGEHPQAADSVGINVKKMRYSGVLISGAVGGLGGIAYVTAGVSMCNFGVAGFGFLALAVMIFGQWKPLRIGIAALLFGFFRALANVYSGFDFLTALNIPKPVYNMLPYIISLIVLAFTSKKSLAPKAEGIPYDKGSR